MKRIKTLFKAKWSIRKDYAEARINKDEIGWHYSRPLKIGRVILWQPRWLCAILAGRDLLRRVG